MIITEWITANPASSWAVLGFVLLLAEIVLPGIFLVWFGAAALAVAVILALLGSALSFLNLWQWQLCLFMPISVLFIVQASRYFAGGKRQHHTTRFMNRTVESLLGQTFPLHTELRNNSGTIRAHDTIWHVTGKDLAKGTSVRLKDFKNGAFAVEAVETHKHGNLSAKKT